MSLAKFTSSIVENINKEALYGIIRKLAEEKQNRISIKITAETGV